MRSVPVGRGMLSFGKARFGRHGLSGMSWQGGFRQVRLGAVRSVGVGFGYKGMVRQARFGRDRQVGLRYGAVSPGAAWQGRHGDS